MSRFIVEPFCAHTESEELYVAIFSRRQQDIILFYEQGGVEIGDVDAKARQYEIPVSLNENEMAISNDAMEKLLGPLDKSKKTIVAEFIRSLYEVYKSNYFTYLEINPLGKWSI